MTIDNDKYHQLLMLIEKNFFFVPKNTSIHSTMEQDIGFTGIDALNFMELYFEKFNIDNTINPFDISKYFLVERVSLIRGILILFKLKPKLKAPEFDLTLEHLVTVMELGYWIDMKK